MQKLSQISLACLVLMLSIFILPAVTGNAAAQPTELWTHITTLPGDCCQTFAIDPVNPDVLYAGTTSPDNGGVFMSGDAGENWQRLKGNLPYPLRVTAIAVAPNAPNIIFVGSETGPNGTGVFLSTTGGNSWTNVTNNILSTLSNPSSSNISAITISPNYSQDHAAFLAINYGEIGGRVFRTTDSGTTWQPIGPEKSGYTAITISPNYSQDHTVFFLGSSSPVSSKSTDGGDTWQGLPTGVGGPVVFSPNYSQDHTLFSGGQLVYRSTDNGVTWTNTFNAAPDGAFVTVSPNFVNDHAIIAFELNKGIFLSYGGTAPWTPISEGLTDFCCGKIQFDGNQRLVVNTSHGLWRYTFSNLRLPSTPVTPSLPSADINYFPETSHTLSFGFKYFWEHSGGLSVFGYPLTQEFKEANSDNNKVYTVQYFERERYEYHPEFKGTPYETELGRLGVLDAQQNDLLSTIPFQSVADNKDSNCAYFPTSHKVCGKFLTYWQLHGLDFGDPSVSYRESLALFGYPISEQFTDPQTGFTVQYFERARLEYHPQYAGTTNEIELGLLGKQTLQSRGWQ